MIKSKRRREKDEIPHHRMTFSGLKRKLLVVHSLGVKLRERVGPAAKRGVHGPIYLVEAGSDSGGYGGFRRIWRIPSHSEDEDFERIGIWGGPKGDW
ncbi:hypothetical protein SDJN03_14549, partial [Cucurbita argyrosperma subsp. sororia]